MSPVGGLPLTLVAEVELFLTYIIVFRGWIGEAFYCFFELDVLLGSRMDFLMCDIFKQMFVQGMASLQPVDEG